MNILAKTDDGFTSGGITTPERLNEFLPDCSGKKFGPCKPKAKFIASIRLGAAEAAAARAPVDSNSGKARPTPAARRKSRRVGLRPCMLLAPESGAGDDGVHQRAEAVILGFHFIQNGRDRFAIGV